MELELHRRIYEVEDWLWWCVGTRRIFFELITRTGVRGRALDVGCGSGVMMKEFPPGWTLVAGCDVAPEPLALSQERGLRQLVRGRGTELPFASASFDLVLAIDVLEHLDDDQGALREIHRICRPGGYLLVHVPTFEILWTDKDDVNHHRRRYRPRALLRLIAGNGFTVERSFQLNATLFPVALLRAAAQRLRRGGQASAPLWVGGAVDRLYDIPAGVNRLLTRLMALEYRLLSPLSLPIGMSTVCLAQKPPADGRG